VREECELTGVSAHAVTLHTLSGDATTARALIINQPACRPLTGY